MDTEKGASLDTKKGASLDSKKGASLDNKKGLSLDNKKGARFGQTCSTKRVQDWANLVQNFGEDG